MAVTGMRIARRPAASLCAESLFFDETGGLVSAAPIRYRLEARSRRHATTRSRSPGAETWRRAAGMARAAAVGRHRVDRSGHRAPPALRERRGLRHAANSRVSHLVFNAVYDFQGLLPVHFYNAMMTVLPLLIPRLHRFGENVGAITLALLILVAHMFVVWAMGITSDLHVYYTLAGAFLLLLGVQNWRIFLVIFVLYLAALLFALNFAPLDGFISPRGRQLRDLLSTQAMVNTIAINRASSFSTPCRRCGAPSSSCNTSTTAPRR